MEPTRPASQDQQTPASSPETGQLDYWRISKLRHADDVWTDNCSSTAFPSAAVGIVAIIFAAAGAPVGFLVLGIIGLAVGVTVGCGWAIHHWHTNRVIKQLEAEPGNKTSVVSTNILNVQKDERSMVSSAVPGQNLKDLQDDMTDWQQFKDAPKEAVPSERVIRMFYRHEGKATQEAFYQYIDDLIKDLSAEKLLTLAKAIEGYDHTPISPEESVESGADRVKKKYLEKTPNLPEGVVRELYPDGNLPQAAKSLIEKRFPSQENPTKV